MINSIPDFDLEAIVNRAKMQWMAAAKQQVSIQERIALTVPWWLIIIFAGLVALSAGHTVGVFSHLSPIGYAGPFVVEFSLLWAAFARGVSRQSRKGISLALRFLEVIAFIMAIAANGIGAASYIADRTQVAGQSWSGILQSFGTLPLATQLELLFVPLFALLIPVGTWASGEGIADLILTERRIGSYLEQQWRAVEREQIRRALYAELIIHLSAADARRQSEMLSAALSGGQRTVPRPDTDSVRLLPERTVTASAKPRQRVPAADARTKVREYLDGHPDDVSALSVRELAALAGVGKTVAADELAKWKQEHGR